jgi:hypothetical protein
MPSVSSGDQGCILSGAAASGTHVNGGIYAAYGWNSGTTTYSGGAVYAGAIEGRRQVKLQIAHDVPGCIRMKLPSAKGDLAGGLVAAVGPARFSDDLGS